MPKSPFDIKIKIPKASVFDYGKSGKKIRAPVAISTQKEIFIRAKGKCERCKNSLKGLKPHIHHKDKNPKNNKKGNLVLLCPNCHSKKHLKDKQKRKKKSKKSLDIFGPTIKMPKVPKIKFF